MNAIRRCKPLLGTYVEIAIQDSVSDKALMALSQQAFDVIEDIENTMSFHREQSLLSQINRQAYLSPVAISQQMHQVLSLALDLSDMTDGIYDITVTPQLIQQGLLPDHGWLCNDQADWTAIVLEPDCIYFRQRILIDLGGIAKGFAVDQAMTVLKETDAVVNAGGDLKMSQWHNKTASIRNSAHPKQAFHHVPMRAASLATSGHYFLESDKQAIVDPRMATAVNDNQASVSVFADSCMLADALTKVAMLSPDKTDVFATMDAHLVSH